MSLLTSCVVPTSLEDVIFDTSTIRTNSTTGAFAAQTFSTSLTAAITINDGGSSHYLEGTDANDIIYGNGGNDEIIDDWGNDKLYGGYGDDTLDSGFGSDYLNGGPGNDVIRAWEANDTIIGGAGNDSIITGTGRDIIIFNTALSKYSNVDRISDYNVPYDTIRLENAVFKKLTTTGILASGAFRTGAKALDTSDRIIYDKGTGALYYDPDGSGSYAQIKFAQLAKNLTMTYSDFVVI